MQPLGLRPDNWRKILETVGFCDIPGSRMLVTCLKYFKSEINGPASYEERLDFDLNDPGPAPGDGQITVDRGFINMWAPDGDPTQPPVTVRTRKVAHINGIRPETQKRFVCLFGYAYAAMEMLFGRAQDPPKTATPWIEPAQEPSGGQTTPAPPANTVASTAIKMLADCAQDLTAKNLDLSDKWMAGQLTLADLAQYSAEIGARIAGDPWRFMQAISEPQGGDQ
jgi:hypothetical protein